MTDPFSMADVTHNDHHHHHQFHSASDDVATTDVTMNTTSASSGDVVADDVITTDANRNQRLDARQKISQSPQKPFQTVSLRRLKSISKDVEQRRLILGKSWDELQLALSQYHASLVVRHEQFDLQSDDSTSYITKLENELERRNTEIEQLRSRLGEVEDRYRALQEENVVLRTDSERSQNEVKIKENLIAKLQTQMSKESMEYSAEINSLKDTLNALNEGQRKRPRLDEVPVQKSDTPIGGRSPAHDDVTPPTFSVANMPHLALPTTSSEALETTQNDASKPTYRSSYDVTMTTSSEVGHQMIQVPQAKTKKRGVRSPRLSRPGVEVVHPSLISAHICKVCGRTFGARYDLQRHERIHSGEKPYFCSGCNRRFARKDHLRLHMVRVHGLEEGVSLVQKESVEVLIQGEDKDPLTVLREQQLAYQESLQGEVKLEPPDNYPLFPENEATACLLQSCDGQ